MKDGLQNVPFDRFLMRVKDVCSIISSLFAIVAMALGWLWIGFNFIKTQNEQQKTQNEQQKLINTLLQEKLDAQNEKPTRR